MEQFALDHPIITFLVIVVACSTLVKLIRGHDPADVPAKGD